MKDEKINWIEIIQIRLTRKDQKQFESELKQLIAEVNQATDHILTIYKKYKLDTDIRIHLHHNSSEIKQNGSPLGLRLTSAFKDYGLVNHSVWVEVN
jgi:hypothetical protein